MRRPLRGHSARSRASQKNSVEKTEKKVVEVSLEVADIKLESTELDMEAIKTMNEF